MRLLTLLLLVPLLLTRPARADDDLAAARRAADAFGLDLWRAAAKPGENVVLSPFSVATALGMTSAGAAGVTLDEMRKVLRFELPADRQHAALGALARDLGKAEKVELNVANRLFALQGKAFQGPFLATTREAYGADAQELPFRTDPDGSRRTINGWVAERTRDRIKDLLQPIDVRPDTKLVLVNAIYFKGTWETKFAPAQPGPFRLGSGEEVQVPLMSRAGDLRAAKLDGLVACDVPYQGGRFVLTLLVPDRHDGVAALEGRLAADLGGWLGALRERPVRLTLPKLKVGSRASLGEALAGMGMPSAFSDAAADFTPMTGSRELKIAKVIHQAFLLVDEEGSEAAAATAVTMAPRGMPSRPPEPLEVRADRPHLLLIRDLRTGVVLFMARVVDPR
jgi:serpin B